MTLRILLIRAVHRVASLTPLVDRVVLLAPQTARLTGNLAAIHAEIRRRPARPRVVVLTAPSRAGSRTARALRQATFDLRAALCLATSRLSVLDDYLFALYVVRPRRGTTVVQTWHATGAFKRMGRSLADRSFGGGAALLDRVPIHANFDLVLVSSKQVVPHYAEAFGQPPDRFVSEMGIPRTDVLFGDAAATAARAVRHRYGISRDRTVLLYAPTFRGESTVDARAPELLDLPALERAIGRDHLLLVRLHPFVRERLTLDSTLRRFVVDVSDHPEMNELLLVSDVLITDYSSTIFEFALLGRPIVFFAPDLESYERERGFYFDYRTGVPGPIFRDTTRLAGYLRAGTFDAERLRAVAAGRAAFDVADGHASERFVDRIVLPLCGPGAASRREDHGASGAGGRDRSARYASATVRGPMRNDPERQPVPASSTRQPASRAPRVTPARVVATLLLVAMVGLSAGLLAYLDLPTGAAVAAPITTPDEGGVAPSDDPGTPSSRPVGPTPNASVVITPPPAERARLRGTVLFVRTGDIWAATEDSLTQLSDKGTDSWPVWSPDGSRIYFVDTRTKVGQAPYQGRFSKITLYYPTLMSMAADGTDRQPILSSLYSLRGASNGAYFYRLLQADLSPDGRTFALVSDAPDPFTTDVTLSTLPVGGGKVKNLGVEDTRGLGHNDPDWSPDGRQIAFTYNGRSGSVGTPRIGIYTPATRKLRFVGAKGYANPSWSPDGRHLLVERTDGKGRDIAILDALTGEVANRLTVDGASFAPVFSPDGSQVAYLRVKGQAIDLRVLTLAPDGSLSVTDDRAITDDGSIDPESSLAWSFPADLQQSIPTPAPTGSAAPSASPASTATSAP